MSKKKIVFLIIFFMVISVFAPRLNADAATGGLQVMFNNNGISLASYNTINANFKLVNNGSSSINLADITLRYYYTADSDKPQNFWCDHAGMLNEWTYTGVTDKVTGTFHKISSPAANADSYLEVGFKSNAGTLSAGGYIEIYTRVARTDWTNYDMSNDYSFKTFGSYGENEKITAYLKGNLIYGNESVIDIQVPAISPANIAHDKYVQEDVSITLAPNGNTFRGIVGLIQGKDYTVSGNTVTLKKEYIDTLPIGVIKLSFDFGTEKNPELTLTLKDTTPKPLINVKIGSAEGNPDDIISVPVTFENMGKAGGINLCSFDISYDPRLLEAVSAAPGSIITNAEANFSYKIEQGFGVIKFIFIDDTAGNEMITSDGVFTNITFRLKSTVEQSISHLKFENCSSSPGLFGYTADGSVIVKPIVYRPFSVIVGKATGAPGNTVTVPVTFSGVKSVGNVGTFNFYIKYDKAYLTAQSVSVGDIIVNPEVNFFSKINADTGIISFVFIDNTLGDELITSDGVLADIKFELQNVERGGSTPLVFEGEGAFGDGEMNKITWLVKTAGCVDIVVNPVNPKTEPKISPDNVTMYQDSCQDLSITIDSGGNTFKGILGLSEGVDYIVSGETVIILKSCLENLRAETNVLTFDFGVEKNPVLALKIYPNQQPQISPSVIQLNKGNLTDIRVTLIPNGYTFIGITGLTKGSDYTVSGNIVTILKNYIASLPIGTKLLVFDFGTYNNPVLTLQTVVGPVHPLEAAIGSAEGVQGDIVTLPVTLSKVQQQGNVGLFHFFVGYDKNLLEAVSVTPGEIIANPDENFSSRIDTDAGKISILFLDNTIGSQLIESDGAVVYLAFRITGNRDTKTPLIFTDKKDFGDGQFERITNLNLTDGSVALIHTDDSEATITPADAFFKLGAKSDIKVTLAPNGNVFNGIFGLTEGTDYTVSGDTVTILNSCLNRMNVGTNVFTFDFGVKNNPVLNITITEISTKPAVRVIAGKATGKPGDMIVVPVSFADVSKAGNVGVCNFYLGYDPKKMEAVSVEAGPIVKSAYNNFSSKINLDQGTISLLFLDNTLGDELIEQDGVFANIRFKIKDTFGYDMDCVLPITFKEGGAFGDGSFSKIENIKTSDGCITVVLVMGE